MSLLSLRFQHVSFSYPAAVEPLFTDVSIYAAPGWSGIVGPNGAGKTTFLKLATGSLEADGGHIDVASQALYCPQRTDSMPEKAAGFNRRHRRHGIGYGDGQRIDHSPLFNSFLILPSFRSSAF